MNGTKQALILWEKVKPEVRLAILNNVWCGRCVKCTAIANSEASVIKGDLLLNGSCINCGSKVARLIEME